LCLVLIGRCLWANYFDSQGIHYAFYSAANAITLQEARREAAEVETRLELPQITVVDGEKEVQTYISAGLWISAMVK
jgi:hypothetical protein